ncbi:MAG TPA: DUF4476 domain-containing protein, partial [Flavobacterium sp.]|nr:DUF4476 domain-containing protein [Flavobacterium sp.]
MKQILLLAVALLQVSQTFAQRPGQFGHLTIFSEDGDRFTLVLNGEQINDTPQTNLRVEDLTQPYYNAKIIFEDATKQSISKNNLMIADADGVFMDVTYKIKRDRNNASKMKMNFFSMIDVDPGFLPPANVKVIHYGQPAPPPVAMGTVTQTTTTTTTGGVNAGVNVGGIGVNISIQDPDLQVTHTQTTTTSSSHQETHGGPSHGPSRGCRNQYAMSPGNFSSALATVRNQKFDDTRLKTAKQIVSSNCLNANQIAEICRVFAFEDSKLDFAKAAFTSCTEPNNYFKVNDVFEFSTSVD